MEIQVYYDMYNLRPPMEYKSIELKRLYGHVRHPSFFGLSVILWATNIMTLDRAVLAILWTVYMYVAWGTDRHDVTYHRAQLSRKKEQITQ